MRQQHYRFAHQVFFHKVYNDPEGWWNRLVGGQAGDVGRVWVEAGEGLPPHELISASLRLDRVTHVQGVDAVVVTMPEPLNPTEAHYVAVCRRPGGPIRYYVLEKGVDADDGSPRAYWAEWRGAPGGGVMRIRGQDISPVTVEAFLGDIASELEIDVSVRGDVGAGGYGGGGGVAPGFRNAQVDGPSRSSAGPLVVGGAVVVPVVVGALIHVVLGVGLMLLFFSAYKSGAELPALGAASTGCGVLTNLAVGFLYALMHKRQKPVNAGAGAAGGAVSGAVARLVGGVVDVIVGIVLVPVLYGAESFSPLAGLGGSMVGICTGTFVAAAIGAIGGVIGGAIFANKT